MTRTLPILLALFFPLFWTASLDAQINYAANVLNGNWSDASTWTPAGGPPTAADNALIGSGIGAAIATVSLTGNETALRVSLGQTHRYRRTLATPTTR